MKNITILNFAGAARFSPRFSPYLALYPFSPPPHPNNGPYWPSHPLLATTPLPPLPPPPSIPLPVLWTPLHLSALMPPSPASPLPPPPPPPAVVTWCLNSNSLNSATSTKIFGADENVKSIYFNHPSQGNSANYCLILGLRDKAAPPTSQQINKFPPKRVKNLATPSSIFIFIFSSSTGELCFRQMNGLDRGGAGSFTLY